MRQAEPGVGKGNTLKADKMVPLMAANVYCTSSWVLQRSFRLGAQRCKLHGSGPPSCRHAQRDRHGLSQPAVPRQRLHLQESGGGVCKRVHSQEC